MDGKLRKIFHQKLPGHWQSIETGGTGRGIPDSNFCIKGVEGWVEFKKADHWKVGIAPHQVAWIERRRRNGGRAFIAVRRAEEELWLLRPTAGRYLLRLGLNKMREAHSSQIYGVWLGGPARWDWNMVEEILTKSIQ